ncbi:MAG: PhzF family phenazine biosynthesis protein [Clostridium sp.]
MRNNYPDKAYIVNAFTKNNAGGNKAGVVINCGHLTSEEMLKIAAHLNLSETAFITKLTNPLYDYEVRFFTPTTEVDLCGHATIAAFYTLGKLGLLDNSNERLLLKQKTLAGILNIEVSFKNGSISSILMTQTPPEFHSYIENSSKLCSILGISPSDAGISGVEIKPMIVSTGLKDIIFPVNSLNTLKKITPDFEKLKNYTDNLNIVGLHAFTFETENSNSSVATRNFGPSVGIDEESATGTSNGALCAYIMKHNLMDFCTSLQISCEQGYYMDNPSEILCQGTLENNLISIKVGGTGSIEKIVPLTDLLN